MKMHIIAKTYIIHPKRYPYLERVDTQIRHVDFFLSIIVSSRKIFDCLFCDFKYFCFNNEKKPFQKTHRSCCYFRDLIERTIYSFNPIEMRYAINLDRRSFSRDMPVAIINSKIFTLLFVLCLNFYKIVEM